MVDTIDNEVRRMALIPVEALRNIPAGTLEFDNSDGTKTRISLYYHESSLTFQTKVSLAFVAERLAYGSDSFNAIAAWAEKLGWDTQVTLSVKEKYSRRA